MTDVICPLCGKPNPPDREECLYCQAPLKASGFVAPSEPGDEENQLLPPSGETGEAEEQTSQPAEASSLEQAIPDWLKATEANFLGQSESEQEKPGTDLVSEQIDSLLNQPSTPDSTNEPAIDDDWLASLLEETGIGESSATTSQEESSEGQEDTFEADKTEPFSEELAQEEPPASADQAEKPEWLTNLEATSPIKLDRVLPASEPDGQSTGVVDTGEETGSGEMEIPEWIAKSGSEVSPPSDKEAESQIAPAELPSWLEALRPDEGVSPTGPLEDLSAADIVTAGPLVGLRGVISAHPSAIRAHKPPTYSIKLRVTEEQRARVEMMEALLADEQKPKPLPAQPVISSRNIFRLVIVVVLILPIAWMIITGSQRTPAPQPGNIPGVVDFTQQVQTLPIGAPVLLAFDYEAGFSGEMNLAISTVINQLIIKNAYMAIVTTTPAGPALAESIMRRADTGLEGKPETYYTDLGYIPGGTIGLLGLANSPKTVLPYSLDGNNVWAVAPLNAISSIKDFSAVIVMTNDPDIARSWIEQVSPQLQVDGTPLLIVTSSQAEPLIRPYYEATPSQVQGLVAGFVGGLAFSRTVGNIQQNGTWDAFSIGITVSVLIILIGSIIAVVLKMLALGKLKEN